MTVQSNLYQALSITLHKKGPLSKESGAFASGFKVCTMHLCSYNMYMYTTIAHKYKHHPYKYHMKDVGEQVMYYTEPYYSCFHHTHMSIL